MRRREEIFADCQSLPPEERLRLFRDVCSSQAFWNGLFLDRIQIVLSGVVGAPVGGIVAVGAVRYCESHGFKENPLVAFWCSPVIVLEFTASRMGPISHLVVGGLLYGAYAVFVAKFCRPRWLMIFCLFTLAVLNVLFFYLAYPLTTWT